MKVSELSVSCILCCLILSGQLRPFVNDQESFTALKLLWIHIAARSVAPGADLPHLPEIREDGVLQLRELFPGGSSVASHYTESVELAKLMKADDSSLHRPNFQMQRQHQEQQQPSSALMQSFGRKDLL